MDELLRDFQDARRRCDLAWRQYIRRETYENYTAWLAALHQVENCRRALKLAGLLPARSVTP